MKTLQFSAEITCFNEAVRLEHCLQSLSPCDEIVVYDMGSTDGSLEIAHRYAHEVRHIKRVDIVEKIWKKIVGEAKNDWIILLDPDEVFPTALFPKIVDIIDSQPEIALISIPWKFYFLGKPLTSTLWGGKNLKLEFLTGIMLKYQVNFLQG